MQSSLTAPDTEWPLGLELLGASDVSRVGTQLISIPTSHTVSDYQISQLVG